MVSARYDFCRDQGAIIGGLLALAAGYLVFRGATHAAARQVEALTAQTEALRQRNHDLRNEGQRRQARDGIVATKLVASVLGIIRNDVDNLKQLLDQPRYTGTARIVPANYRQLIYKPPLNIVWDDLGMCSPDIIGNTCSSMPDYRNSREPRFMPSTSCKTNCRSSRIFSRFWSATWRAAPRGTTSRFRKPRNTPDLLRADRILERGQSIIGTINYEHRPVKDKDSGELRSILFK